MADRYKIVGIATHFEQVVSTREIDAVYICVPTAFHLEVAQAALRAGKAVFCEKPLAPTLADVGRLIACAAETGMPNQVGLPMRHLPVTHAIKRAVSSARAGKPLLVTLRNDQCFPNRGLYKSTWRNDVKVAGGGLLIEHDIHDIDMLLWMFGDITEVRCQTRSIAGHPGIEDVAVLEMNHTSGCVSVTTSLWHNLGSRVAERRMEVFLEHGALFLDQFMGAMQFNVRDKVLTLGSGQMLTDYLTHIGESDARKFANAWAFENWAFLKALAERRPPSPPFAAALRAHEIVDAAYRSAASGGGPVKV
jgi:predicted dehydrogenase